MSSYPWHNFAGRPKPDAKSISRRLETFVGGRYKDCNLSSLQYADRRDGPDSIHVECWSAPGRQKPTFDEAKKAIAAGHAKEIGPGHLFGPSWTQHWLKVTMTIPKSWKSNDAVELIFDPSCEAMVFNTAGVALQGITGGFDYNRRVEYIIPGAEVDAGESVRYIEVSANGVFGIKTDPPRDDKYYELATVEIGAVNLAARRLLWDFETLKSLSDVYPDNSPLSNKARVTANQIMNTFDGSMGSVEKCRTIAEDVMGKDWEKAAMKEMGPKGDQEGNGTLWALGYCHIDTAWLWPWSATEQKVARTWSSQIDLSDRYPEYRFMASAAQHYSWLEKLYPKVFARLQEKVKEGKFEVNGGCWVEMDGNMPSGESLCRQFLYGQKYFKSRFGKTTDVLVLPDTFGFGAQIPQIARLGGCSSFFTHKMNWNKVNEFPLTTFNWVGLDGTQLLSHITPIGRYDSDCTMPEIDRAYKRHKNLDSSPESLILYGHGDGGGGPSAVMLERLRRARATGLTSDTSGEHLPLIKTGITLSQFFAHLREQTDNGTRVPDWNGELYLEIHRACQTTQGRTKKHFRDSEHLLREIELLSTLASIHTNFSYPKDRLDSLWEALCLCMFHDTLPGSSIRLAVDDYDLKFAKIKETGQELVDNALRALESDSGKHQPCVLNTLPGLARKEIVTPPGGGMLVAEASAGAICGTAKSYSPPTDAGVKIERIKEGFVMSNASLSVTISDGRLSSIYDKSKKREIIPHGKTAGFIIYRDMPSDGDAWEVEQWTLDVSERLEFNACHVIEWGPLRGIIECEMKVGQSSANIKISLDALPASLAENAQSLLRFDCEVDWHERHRMLKFELPADIWSQEATYDSAFGVVRRPTHRNTTWDAAKFEVAAHKFADYSEFGYGVAILNNCKYGYATQGNVMTLSLLRSPTMPDPECDQGKHEFAFAIYPHAGGYGDSDVQMVAHAFNHPLKVVERSISNDWKEFPFSIQGADNVLLETIKRGENDFDARTFIEGKTKSIIIRLHEHMGGQALAKLVIRGVHVAKAAIVNILEDHVEELDVITDLDKEVIDLKFRAFEIKTVQLTL